MGGEKISKTEQRIQD
jgi:hypothetical protein